MMDSNSDRRKMMDSNPGNSGKHFVGLKNQGATCYLNTILQTWFMTQEVKECITSYKEQDLLTYKLWCLFERLSDGNEQSSSTEQLTSQLKLNVFKQRDIEECFRSLVNKLNSKMDQEHNILKIYQVTMVNSLKCLKCTTSMDEDSFFLDIPLSICSANAAEKFDSMEKSLEQFLKEEKMEGDNKGYCTNCEMKTETSSRCYFKHLPQILTFQLKRFEFDYNYMTFQKITDCITFPPVLEFTRSQDVHNEWCLKFTVNRENNIPNNHCSKALEKIQSLLSFLGVQKGTSMDNEGKHPEAVKDQSEEVSKDKEVNNAQNDWHVDDAKAKETADQHEEVNRGDSVVFTGRNPETPQDHSQQVSTGQEEVNAQKDSHADVGKEDDTPVQHQEVDKGNSAVFTGRIPATPQGHSQQVSTGHKVNNAENDSHVDVVKDEEAPVQSQEVDQQVLTGQEEKKYELFAIWHHSGIYGSGHYYAEIKSDSGDWYNFNDENVKKENDFNPCSETAYVLMYRLINAEPPAGRSKKPVDESEKEKPVLSLMMEKLKAGRELAKTVPLRFKGKMAPLPVEGEANASCVEGDENTPQAGGEDGVPRKGKMAFLGRGSESPSGIRESESPSGERGNRLALGWAKVLRS